MDDDLTTIQPLSPDSIRQIIREELQAAREVELHAKLLSPDAARKLFEPAISRSTIDKWTEEGLIPVQKIGGRVWYRYADILEAGSKLRRYHAGKDK